MFVCVCSTCVRWVSKASISSPKRCSQIYPVVPYFARNKKTAFAHPIRRKARPLINLNCQTAHRSAISHVNEEVGEQEPEDVAVLAVEEITKNEEDGEEEEVAKQREGGDKVSKNDFRRN